MRSSVDVLGIGTNSLDLVYFVPEWPQPHTSRAKVRVSAHRLSPGGQTTTALATCAALGRRTAYAGAFGNDAHGAFMRDELARRGIDLRPAVVRDAPNRYAVIVIDERHGERVILWDRAPALALREQELPVPLLRRARVVHVDDEDEAMAVTAASIARADGAIVTSDIDRDTPGTRALVDAVTIPIFAEHVPAAMTGEENLERALRALCRPHHQMLCVTLGARGAMMLRVRPNSSEYEAVHAAAFRVDVIDTTGAGDVWRGAFIDALLRGDEPMELLRFANAAAAVACTKHGAIGGVPEMAEITELLTTKAR